MTQQEGGVPDAMSARVMLDIHDLMRDGEWREWEEIVRTIAPRVARGMAYRKAEKERIRQRERRKRKGIPVLPVRRGEISEKRLRSGARNFIAEAMRNWERWFERDGTRYRLLATPDRLFPYIDPAKRVSPPPGVVIPPYDSRRRQGQATTPVE
jgi:hypothetical protein